MGEEGVGEQEDQVDKGMEGVKAEGEMEGMVEAGMGKEDEGWVAEEAMGVKEMVGQVKEEEGRVEVAMGVKEMVG